jgi:hypothetical protein
MAYCQIAENPDATQEQFEQLNAHLRANGPFPPDGQRLLIAGPAEPGWRVISVWDSEEAIERFNAERLPDACRATGVPLDRMTRTVYEVHTLVAGDLTGAPQPA